MSLWGRLSEWATVDKLGTVADLLFKLTALVAALAAANFFYYQPDVKLTTNSQAFIDLDTLRASYNEDGSQPLPDVVRRVATEYNAANVEDLRTGANSTASKVPASELCADLPDTVDAVFPEADCRSSQPTLGRARYYERLLLKLNADRRDRLGNKRLREALGRLRSAEYLKARCAITNGGNAKAANVQIRPSDGFFLPNGVVNDPFALEPNPGHPFHRTFQSSPGALDRDPQLEFGIDWTRAGLTNTGPATLIATILLIAFALVMINDFVKSMRTTHEKPPHV